MEKSKGKGKATDRRIAPELHSELTEYNSLLRALRTTSTMDMTKHLSQHYQGNAKTDYYLEPILRKENYYLERVPTPEDSEDDYSPESSRASSPAAGPSTSPHTPRQVRKRHRSHSPQPLPPTSSPERKKQKQRAAWTKWPLLLNDVPKPQWMLHDEIATMLSIIEERDDDEDEPEYLPNVSLAASSFLESLLAVIAVYTPARADSLQNRLNPIDWKYVISVMASEKNMNPTYIPFLSSSAFHSDLP